MAYDATPVTVSVTLNTAVGDRATFGTPLFVHDAGNSSTPTPDFSGSRTRIYTDLDSMVDDGFLTSSDAYKAAQAFFSQNPSVQQIVIGQQYTAGTPDADSVAAVTAISEENDDWYVLTHYDHTEANVLALAAYIEARKRMYFVSDDTTASATTAYSPPAASGDIVGKLADGNYTRTASLWTQESDSFKECAFAGHNLPFEAGKATWSYLSLNGCAAGVINGNPLTATHQTNLAARNANFLPIIRGLTVTREGKVASGEWIDKQEPTFLLVA